jgi:hypothetical protein
MLTSSGIFFTIVMALCSLVAVPPSWADHNLPLKEGLYVPAGIKCGPQRPLEYIFYAPGGFSDGSQTEYELAQLRKNGNTFSLSGKSRTGMGGRSLGDFNWQLVIINDTSFSKDGRLYRYCRATVEEKLAQAAEQDLGKRYSIAPEKVITDSKTGLEWFLGPNQELTWEQAQAWAASLQVAGGGWRLPSLRELRTLYHHGLGSYNISPLFQTIHPHGVIRLDYWADEPAGPSPQKARYSFLFGEDRFLEDRSRPAGGVLAVRPKK